MKKRSLERVERRRAQVELNMAEDGRPRAMGANRGCASLLGRLFVGVLLSLVLVAGLS